MSTLRDHLLHALSTHPGTRTFHLHVLVTAPRKSNALYPFATPRAPRVYLQDVLVILSEQRLTTLNEDDEEAPKRVIVTAIEASLYHIPTTSSVVLYVSKVDSTGQATAPSPTGVLMRALLGFYADPKTRPQELEGTKYLWIQLFARAQGQYLFANSAEWEGKKALGDRGLCSWWKRVLGRVVGDVHKPGLGVKMYYLLPGYGEEEAEHELRNASPPGVSLTMSLPDGVRWEYGHPYSQKMPMPCPVEDEVKNLGRFIPYFDDDPKSRFLDEIAYTTDGDVKSPQRKRQRTNTGASEKKEEKKEEKNKPLGEMGRVTPDEFWERMSFRQECVAGAVTGFFTVVITSAGSTPTKSPLEPRPGQVAAQVNKRIMTTLLTGVEFSTVDRAIKATETVEGAIRGLCEGIPAARPKTPERESGPFLAAPPRTPPRRAAGVHVAEVSPNPFPEPIASLETYEGHIYGRVSTTNAVVAAPSKETEHVTVLAVRRKKKAVS